MAVFWVVVLRSLAERYPRFITLMMEVASTSETSVTFFGCSPASAVLTVDLCFFSLQGAAHHEKDQSFRSYICMIPQIEIFSKNTRILLVALGLIF
jgi:hypothetical protein